MLRWVGVGFLLSTLAATAAGQEDLDAAIRERASRLIKEGISAKLAEAAATDAGLQALRERIDSLIGARTARIERDGPGHYEDYLFSQDAAGDFALRPERRAEFEALAARVARASRSMDDFDRRCDALVQRLGDSSEMDKRARAAWSDPAFRVAFFHRHPAELRERTEDELMELFLSRSLVRGDDGLLRVGGLHAQEIRDRMQSIYDQLEAVKRYEKSFLKQAIGVIDESARRTVSSDTGILFILGRVVRQATEGSAESIGGLTEGDLDNNVDPGVSFNLELHELAPLVAACEKQVASLRTRSEALAAALAGNGVEEVNVLKFLKNDRARVLLAERMLALRSEQRAKADEILSAVLEDGFTAEGDRLSVKKGRYVDDAGNESPDQLAAELSGVLEEFRGTVRFDFDRVAERCTEPALIALFEDRPGTFLLMEHRDEVLAALLDAIRSRGLEIFTQAYLVKQGEEYAVRPDRVRRVEEILKRAEEIRKSP